MITKLIYIDNDEVWVEYYIESYPDRNSYDGCGEVYEIEVDEFHCPIRSDLTFEIVTEELKKQLEYEREFNV